jgi:crossover junction endodeoxyribonuclease RuvC
MVILGIDPGFGRLGYGIIDYTNNKYKVLECGCITTEADSNFPDRLEKIEEDLQSVVSRYKIDAASIEELFFNTNITTGIKVAEARGVILCTLKKANIKIFEYTPLEIKQAITGFGRAKKPQVMDMVKSTLKLQKMPKLDDTADALAMCICHASTHKYEDYVEKYGGKNAK